MRAMDSIRGALALFLGLAVTCALVGAPGAIWLLSGSEESSADSPATCKSFSPAAECAPLVSAAAPQWFAYDVVSAPALPSFRILEGSPTAPRSPPAAV